MSLDTLAAQKLDFFATKWAARAKLATLVADGSETYRDKEAAQMVAMHADQFSLSLKEAADRIRKMPVLDAVRSPKAIIGRQKEKFDIRGALEWFRSLTTKDLGRGLAKDSNQAVTEEGVAQIVKRLTPGAKPSVMRDFTMWAPDFHQIEVAKRLHANGDTGQAAHILEGLAMGANTPAARESVAKLVPIGSAYNGPRAMLKTQERLVQAKDRWAAMDWAGASEVWVTAVDEAQDLRQLGLIKSAYQTSPNTRAVQDALEKKIRALGGVA